MLHDSCDGHHRCRRFLLLFLVPVMTVLSACGGSSDSSGNGGGTYLISGTVSGTTGGGLVLSLNGDETLEVGGVSFSFGTKLPSGSGFEIIIMDSPAGHHCEVHNGSGTVGGSDVTDVEVLCRNWREAQPVPGAGTADSSVGEAEWDSGRIHPVVDEDGNAVVFWWQTHGPVRGSRYVAGSGWDPVELLGDNAYNGVLKSRQPIVMDAQGNATLLWHESDNPGSSATSLTTRASRYVKGAGWRDPADLPPVPAGPIGIYGNGGYPAAAVDVSGNVMAVWHAWHNTPVWARYDAASGVWETDDFAMMQVGQTFLFDLAVDSSQPGAFMMVWAQQNALYARRYTPASGWSTPDLITSEAGLITMGAVPGDHPALAMDDQGNAIVAWSKQEDPGSAGARGMWVSHYSPATGWNAPESIGPVGGKAVQPQLVMDAAGRAVLTWRRGEELWAASHDPDEGWYDAGQIGPADSATDLALVGEGKAQVVFTSGASVLSRRFCHEAGWGETVTVYDAGDDSGIRNGVPTISFGADGTAFATWLRRLPDGDGSDDVEYYFSRLDLPSAFIGVL